MSARYWDQRSRFAAETSDEEPIQISRPARVLLTPELMKIIPRENSGVVQVVEQDADGVVSDWLDAHYAHVAPAGHDPTLGCTMALYLGARTLDAQILGRQQELGAVVEADSKPPLGRLKVNFEQNRRLPRARYVRIRHVGNRHVGSSGRASSGSMIGIPSRTG